MHRATLISSVMGVVALATSACTDPLKGHGQATPAFYAKNVQAYGETVQGLPPDAVLGYDLVVVGDVARWRECTSPEVCGTTERTRPASALVGIERVSKITIEGREVDVMRLSLAAPPKYVVPTWKPGTLR